MVSLRLHITGQVSGTKAIMRAARAEGGVRARGAKGARVEVAYESCQRLIFPSVVGAR